MKIVPIFAPNLYAIAYGEDEGMVWDRLMCLYFELSEIGRIDELERLLELWNNPLYLEEFFEANKADLQSGFFGSVSVEQAVKQTRESAERLHVALIKNEAADLGQLFKPLSDVDCPPLRREKAKRGWLRIYAIKIDENRFLITGGAIKLTKKMQERPHTKIEISKFQKIAQYLKNNGVFDGESFNDFEFELSI